MQNNGRQSVQKLEPKLHIAAGGILFLIQLFLKFPVTIIYGNIGSSTVYLISLFFLQVEFILDYLACLVYQSCILGTVFRRFKYIVNLWNHSKCIVNT